MRRSRTAKALASRPRWRYDPDPWLIGDGVARFRDPRHADQALPPFPALLKEPAPLGRPTPSEFPSRPAFAGHARRSLIQIRIEPGSSLYGTGEVAGPLIRNGRTTTGWTTDSFDYTDRTPSLYQAHPWVLAVRPDGSAFGAMVETTWRHKIDLRRGIRFEIDGPSPAVIIIDRASPQQVIHSLSDLTGRMPMPPRWALGYHQCRWSYEPDSRVRDVARQFRERGIPCDCLWLDIDYMDGFKCFTFDRVKFPNPSKLNTDLHAQGFKTVWMIDPGIKVEQGYPVYDSGRAGPRWAKPHTHPPGARPAALDPRGPEAASHFVQTASRHEYHGEVWPGACAFPDFTRQATRDWWASLYHDFLATGLDGVWNDMNEPAVFDQPGKAMPIDCRHDADNTLGGPGPHARYRNIYGMQMVRASRDGIAAIRPDRRPFVLTRSNFLGGHRYAATWTGDNRSDWSHLAWSIPMVLNLGLSGQPFCGPDIGGFVGDATPELFARWMGIGALLPFARGHSIKGSKDHEPWAFGADCEQSCRAALQLRYRLLPYLYTLFHEASTRGLPVVRPVFFADPADPRLRAIDDAFLIGADLLVQTAVNERPDGGHPPSPRSQVLAGWRSLEIPGLAPHRAGALPRLYIRPGSIIPLGPVMQYSDEKPVDPLMLVVCPDDAGSATGSLYEDAGEGLGYQRGEFRITAFQGSKQTGRLHVKAEHTSGSMPDPHRATEIVEI